MPSDKLEKEIKELVLENKQSSKKKAKLAQDIYNMIDWNDPTHPTIARWKLLKLLNAKNI